MRMVAAGAAAAALAVAAPAAAHVQVTPSRVAPDDAVLFTVLVPNEREVATTRVDLQVPDGAIPFSFEAVPGFKRTEVKAANGSLSVVRWTGRLPPGDFARFAFLAGTGSEPGEIVWKAVQRYADGQAVRWIGAPDSEEPAAVTVIDRAAPRANAGGESRPGSEPAPAEPAASAAVEVDGDSTIAVVLGGLGALLGAVALVLVLRRTRARR